MFNVPGATVADGMDASSALCILNKMQNKHANEQNQQTDRQESNTEYWDHQRKGSHAPAVAETVLGTTSWWTPANE
jgi:hypothetical protein